MRLLIGLLFYSFNLWATDWNDLEISTKYKLTQHFKLSQIERSGSELNLSKGEDFILKDIIALDMINVSLYQFTYNNCPGVDLITELEIIPVEETYPVIEIGAQVEKCVLEVFVESKDLMTKSFFE
jgi:hypothetical protein